MIPDRVKSWQIDLDVIENANNLISVTAPRRNDIVRVSGKFRYHFSCSVYVRCTKNTFIKAH